MFRSLRATFVTCVTFVTFGCGSEDGGTGPAARALAPGAYAVTFTSGEQTWAGTLTLTSATADSVAGAWAVPGWDAALLGGGWSATDEAYALRAREAAGNFAHLQLARESAGVRCRGNRRLLTAAGFETRDATCTAVRQ